jgi:hypothetical protein
MKMNMKTSWVVINQSEDSSLHRSIQWVDSEETIASMLQHNPYLVHAKDENKNSPIQILHKMYLQTVFAGFHHRNKVSTMLHDEWFQNDEWPYVANVVSLMILATASIGDSSFVGGVEARHCIESNLLVVHAAIRMRIDNQYCPIDVIRLLASSPFKKAGIDRKDHEGNLTLHLAIDLLASIINAGANPEDLKQCKCLITDLLDMYPESISVPNNKGKFPITKLMELNSSTRTVDDILVPLMKQFSPSDALIQTLYHDCSSPLTDEKVNCLLSSLGERTSKIDIVFKLLQQVPWVLCQTNVR